MARRKKSSRPLTDLELEIMQVLWSADAAMTVREVAADLGARTKRDHAYTTVQTMLGILVKKGAVRSRPGSGRAHLYSPRLSREDATSSLTRDLVDRVFGGSAEPLLAHLLDTESLDRDALEELKRRIEDQLSEDEE